MVVSFRDPYLSHEDPVQKEETLQEFLGRCIVENSATVEIIAEAIQKGARLDFKDQNDNTLVHHAAKAGALASLIAIFDYLKKQARHEATNNNLIRRFNRWRIAKDPELPPAAIDLLISVNKEGLTPMHMAAESNHEACVRFLASKAETVGIIDSNQQTALILASRKGHLSSVIALEEHRAEICYKGRSGAQAIHFAASSGNPNLVRFFLDKKVPVLSYDDKGRLPSCYAAKSGSVEVLVLLRAHGDPLTGEKPFLKSIVSKGQESPLKHAAKRGHVEAMRYLLGAKVKVDSEDRKGRQPLYEAAKSNKIKSVELLVEHGANFQLLTDEGQLPLDLIENSEWKNAFRERYGMKASSDAYMYASLCYMSSFAHPDDQSALADKTEKKLYQDTQSYLYALGWERLTDCLSICSENPLLLKAIEEHHYYGIIYCREINGEIEIVIAHRGTDLGSVPNLVADGQILAGEIPKLFNEATLPFVETFLSKVVSREGTLYNDKPLRSITHVGFSLGGFLAAAAAARTLSTITFAKTFDAPGIYHLIRADQHKQLYPHIENFVATPNLVNTCQRHLGPIYHFSSAETLENRPEKHEALFEVPSAILISHFLETMVLHDLKEIIQINQGSRLLHLRAVQRWPQAEIRLIYGPFPRDDSFQIGLLNAMSRLAKTLLKKAVWDAMQRRTVDGRLVGLLAVNHRCDYAIVYSRNGDQDPPILPRTYFSHEPGFY